MTPLPPDPYEIIGVLKDAQLPEIRTAYRKLVLKCHPDKFQDPQLKEEKQIEFQRVQQAYELLINETEREKYDRLAEYQTFKEQNEKTKNSAPPVSSNRSPKREGSTFYDVKEASPRPTTFAKASPYGRTPPRSYEDNISTPRFEEGLRGRQARKAASYEKERPSRREEDRRRREKDDDWLREKEKEKEKDRVKEKERKEKDKRDKEKERDRRDKEKKKSSPEKVHRRDSDEKRRHKQPYVEVSPEDPDEVLYSSSYKSDKKKSSSNRRHEEPVREPSRPPVTDRERKNSANLETALRYMQRSGGMPPSLTRAHTFQDESYNVRHAATQNVVPAPTPPPATAAVYPPPPKQEDRDITVEEDKGRRPPGRASARHMSFSKDKSHKKSGASREAPVLSDTETPTSRPIPSFKKSHTTPLGMHSERVPLGRSNTEGFVRPVPISSLDRSQTWYPGGEHDRERSRSRHDRHDRGAHSDADSEGERDHRHRRDRKTHSPGPIPGHQTFRYTVDNGRSVPVPVGRATYHAEETPRAYKTKANGTVRIERSTYPTHGHLDYEDDSGQYFPKVKYAQQFSENEVNYSSVPHSSYRAEGLYT